MTRAVLERRALGRLLRAHRKAAGISQCAAAEVIESSAQTVWRLEGGVGTRISTIQVGLLCDAYQVTDSDREVLMRLAAAVRAARTAGGSAHSVERGPVDGGLGERIAFEQVATAMSTFHTALIPGLLHTGEYHRAVQRSLHPHESAADLDRRVETTLHRQNLLRNNNIGVRTFVLLSALGRSMGGAAVMDRQMAYLEEISRLPNVSIRIVSRLRAVRLGWPWGVSCCWNSGHWPLPGNPSPRSST